MEEQLFSWVCDDTVTQVTGPCDLRHAETRFVPLDLHERVHVKSEGSNPLKGRGWSGVGGGIRTHDSRSHSPEFYH
jgi:hypothetical protein